MAKLWDGSVIKIPPVLARLIVTTTYHSQAILDAYDLGLQEGRHVIWYNHKTEHGARNLSHFVHFLIDAKFVSLYKDDTEVDEPKTAVYEIVPSVYDEIRAYRTMMTI